MIYSMTGFGSARTEADNLTVLVEIKSVNHRYILPRRSSMAENEAYLPDPCLYCRASEVQGARRQR